MINFNFRITNPWATRWRTVYCWSGKLTNHKAWEINLYRSNELVAAECSYTMRQDHAGFNLLAGLFGCTIELHIYDTRHWDYKANRFTRGEL